VRLATLLASVFLLALPASASAKWTYLTSANFAFVGDADEGRIRLVAERLEQFRAVMIRVLPNAAADSPVPTTVFVFRDERSFTPYMGTFRGRTVTAAGYFLAHPDANAITLDADHLDQALSTVFHEYTHFLVSNTVGPLPPWISEGLAEIYRTFEERNGGKAAMVGMPIADHVGLLRLPTVSLMPVAALLAVGHDSRDYNEGIRRSVFYAESWALTHYLMLGSPAREGQLSAYLARVQAGTPPDVAFRQSVGDDLAALDRELREYTRLLRFNAIRIDLGESLARSVVGRGTTLDDAEAEGYLGDLLARMGREEQARAMLTRALDRKGNTARAALALGLHEMRGGSLERALPLLERGAAGLPSDAAAQSAYGRALLTRYREMDDADPAAAATLESARTALQRAVTLMPNMADMLVQAARAELLGEDDAPKAREYLERAVRLAPSREAYRLMLAQALVRQGDVPRATAVLGPLVARGSRADVRDMARRLLASAAQRARQIDVLSLVADGPEEQPDEPLTPRGTTEPPSIAAAAGDSPPSRPTAPPGGRYVPVLRDTQAGEERVFGRFMGVECSANGIVLQISTAARTVRLRAASFDRIDFMTYRPNSPASVPCGPQTLQLPVLATFKAGTGDVPEVVAIELLPDGYVPR
jgi:tetratricopeptide (TPR) repeat protein